MLSRLWLAVEASIGFHLLRLEHFLSVAARVSYSERRPGDLGRLLQRIARGSVAVMGRLEGQVLLVSE